MDQEFGSAQHIGLKRSAALAELRFKPMLTEP